jgi:hypothetical protein
VVGSREAASKSPANVRQCYITFPLLRGARCSGRGALCCLFTSCSGTKRLGVRSRHSVCDPTPQWRAPKPSDIPCCRIIWSPQPLQRPFVRHCPGGQHACRSLAWSGHQLLQGLILSLLKSMYIENNSLCGCYADPGSDIGCSFGGWLGARPALWTQ